MKIIRTAQYEDLEKRKYRDQFEAKTPHHNKYWSPDEQEKRETTHRELNDICEKCGGKLVETGGGVFTCRSCGASVTKSLKGPITPDIPTPSKPKLPLPGLPGGNITI